MRAGTLFAAAALLAFLGGVGPAGGAVDERDLTFRTTHSVKVTQVGDAALLVEELLVVGNPTNETFDGSLSFWVPVSHGALEWQATRLAGGGGAGAAGPSATSGDHVVVRRDGEHDLVALDLGAHDAAVPPQNQTFLRLTYRVAGDAFTMRFARAESNVLVQALAQDGWRPESGDFALTRLTGSQSFYVADGAVARSVAEDATFTLRFVPEPAASAPGSLRANWAWAAIGGAAGAFLVGALVKGGLWRIAGPRAPPGHDPRLAAERPEALLARKRVLMAALRELEVAHRSGDVSADVHAPLKAELMRDATAAARELERRSAAPPADP